LSQGLPGPAALLAAGAAIPASTTTETASETATAEVKNELRQAERDVIITDPLRAPIWTAVPAHHKPGPVKNWFH
jgi:hypothetical protein